MLAINREPERIATSGDNGRSNDVLIYEITLASAKAAGKITAIL